MGKGAASEHQEVAPTSQQKDTPTTVPVAKHQETASYNQQKAIPVAIPEADHEEIVSTRHINATSTTAESGTVAQPLPSRAGNSRSVDDMMLVLVPFLPFDRCIPFSLTSNTGCSSWMTRHNAH